MTKVHYKCMIDIVQPLKENAESIDARKKIIDEEIDGEMVSLIYADLCSNKAKISVDRIVLEFIDEENNL